MVLSQDLGPASSTTTTKIGSDLVRNWLKSLVDEKLQAIFKRQRPERSRSHLSKKWKNLHDMFVRRYQSMIVNGCDFPNTFDEYNVNFQSDSDRVCYVS